MNLTIAATQSDAAVLCRVSTHRNCLGKATDTAARPEVLTAFLRAVVADPAAGSYTVARHNGEFRAIYSFE